MNRFVKNAHSTVHQGRLLLTLLFMLVTAVTTWADNYVPLTSTTTSWTNETSISTFDTVDAGVYTWKQPVVEGDWDNPDNWTVTGVDADDCLGYPNSSAAQVRFVEGTIATIAAGIFLIRNAFNLASLITRIAGGILIFDGISDLWVISRVSKAHKEMEVEASDAARDGSYDWRRARYGCHTWF